MTRNNRSLLERRQKVLAPSYSLFYENPVYLVRGEGVWLFDDEGKKYLDCYNNVASVGHCHPHVVDALTTQARTLNTHTRYLHHGIVEYAEMLAETHSGDLSVSQLVCTGTEANDLAYRIARQVTGNDGAIVLTNTYHGNSTLVTELSPDRGRSRPCPDFVVEIESPNPYRGSISADRADWAERYADLVDGAIATLAERGKRPAMLLIDCIHDSAGILTPPAAYLQALCRKVHAAGGLLVADEVQSGLCRLGENIWGYQDSDVVPDIVTMGKPLGDGHPLAAVTTTRAIAEAFVENGGEYFNTFSGNPVSAAAGKAVLEVIERENVLDNVKASGARLTEGLRELAQRHDLIGDVRGKGLFWGIELVEDRATKAPAVVQTAGVVERMRETGVLIAKTGVLRNILKIRPPLVFRPEHGDLLLERLDAALGEV